MFEIMNELRDVLGVDEHPLLADCEVKFWLYTGYIMPVLNQCVEIEMDKSRLK